MFISTIVSKKVCNLNQIYLKINLFVINKMSKVFNLFCNIYNYKSSKFFNYK